MRSTYLFALLSSLLLVGCGGVCSNEVSQIVSSPSGTLKAVVFSRNCGATTGFNTQVSLLPANEALPDDGANTFIADGLVPIAVQWENDDAIFITGLNGVSPIKKNKQVFGVVVSYAK